LFNSIHQSFLLSQGHVSSYSLALPVKFPTRYFALDFSCCSVTSLREKIAAASSSPSPFRFYNANVETLLVSNSMGGAGFSGISANFYPWMHARLCSKDVTEHDAAAIQRFLSVAEVRGTRVNIWCKLD
jgi:hypothetical protein